MGFPQRLRLVPEAGPSPANWRSSAGGPRICIGNTLAQAEIALVTAHIAQQFSLQQPSWRTDSSAADVYPPTGARHDSCRGPPLTVK